VARRSGLGKGLGALIPTEGVAPTEGGGLKELPISQIRANRFQPRGHFDEESLGSLTESVRMLGVLQPVLVRPLDDGYELIAGERRWRAAKRAGLQTIPAVIKDEQSDVSALEQALVENLHRQDLNALEEAAAYQQLMEDFGLNQEQVARRVGKSRSSVANHLRLFQLPPTVQKLLSEDRITLGHAKVLLSTPDRAYQESLARKIASDDLSVREVEELVRAREELAGQLDGDRSRPGRPRTLRQPGLLELEQLLSDKLSTKVRVDMGAKRGKVVVDFANLEDLERIYRIINT
jgi:ParB family transcriptional regulator, chromosome partitioning protein